MPDYSLVPVDHQPDFDDYALVPVDYDPFAADGLAQQTQIQLAQAQPQPPAGAGQPDAITPPAAGRLLPLVDENHMVDSHVYEKYSTGIPPAGSQVATAKGNLTITATDNATPRISVGFMDIR